MKISVDVGIQSAKNRKYLRSNLTHNNISMPFQHNSSESFHDIDLKEIMETNLLMIVDGEYISSLINVVVF